ncbi:MAG: hypothetical protein KF760_30135 [Candidatus Eremiobacteraeota bacterium]|nr:hypothetical protein [Candidatus Eremiobacteraeota bacterium]MCW5872212.1 hypothetical protein [Candidatus Eremiobacteraeota bacterium]
MARPWLRRTATVACMALSMAGLLAGPVSAAAGEQFAQIEQLTEKAEKKILKESDGRGQIVRLKEGIPGRGIHLSIHGLGAHPGDMAPLTNRAEARGQTTATFAYNDFHGDQKQNARSLASELKGWIAEHPGEKMTIETHSLGGRTILAAFHYLQETGDMPKTAIQLNLISPPLAGFGLLNLALPLPIPVAKLIPGAAAARDMASGSGAQDLLERVRLPDNVKTTIFYGDNDNLIDYTSKGAKKMAENLNAQVYYLAGEHTTTVPSVASQSFRDFSSEPLPYKPHERDHHGPHHH